MVTTEDLDGNFLSLWGILGDVTVLKRRLFFVFFVFCFFFLFCLFFCFFVFCFCFFGGKEDSREKEKRRKKEREEIKRVEKVQNIIFFKLSNSLSFQFSHVEAWFLANNRIPDTICLKKKKKKKKKRERGGGGEVNKK